MEYFKSCLDDNSPLSHKIVNKYRNSKTGQKSSLKETNPIDTHSRLCVRRCRLLKLTLFMYVRCSRTMCATHQLFQAKNNWTSMSFVGITITEEDQ